MEKERPGNYLPEDEGMLPKEKVMLQSKSSAAEIVCDGRLVGIVEGSSIHNQRILVKFAEAWRNRLVTTNSPSLIERYVTGSGKGSAIKAMMEKDMVLGEDLSFHKAFLLGCEGMEGAQKEDIHTDGFRRAFTADGTFMEKFWMEGDDVQECCLSNNGALQTVEEISLI